MQTWSGSGVYGAVQGLQEIASQVVSTGDSLLEASPLCQLHSLLHVPACDVPHTTHLDQSSLHCITGID